MNAPLLLEILIGARPADHPERAQLHGIETRILVQAVKRNLARFPGEIALAQVTAQGAPR